MSPYLDDSGWGTTPSYEIADFKVPCARFGCTHLRYRHGEIRRIRGYGVAFTPGVCEQCKCSEFTLEPPVTEDDVFAAVRMLKIDAIHLADFGIDPIPPEAEKNPPEAW